jgi:hypothetical protein
MLASSLQVLPYSSQITYHLSDTIFIILFQTTKILQANPSVTSRASLSSSHYQSLVAARFRPYTC